MAEFLQKQFCSSIDWHLIILEHTKCHVQTGVADGLYVEPKFTFLMDVTFFTLICFI